MEEETIESAVETLLRRYPLAKILLALAYAVEQRQPPIGPHADAALIRGIIPDLTEQEDRDAVDLLRMGGVTGAEDTPEGEARAMAELASRDTTHVVMADPGEPMPGRQNPWKGLADTGLLFEINRRVLHPFGLAITVRGPGPGEDPQGPVNFAGLWDASVDPEGILFDDRAERDGENKFKAWLDRVGRSRLAARYGALGYVVQGEEGARGYEVEALEGVVAAQRVDIQKLSAQIAEAAERKATSSPASEGERAEQGALGDLLNKAFEDAPPPVSEEDLIRAWIGTENIRVSDPYRGRSDIRFTVSSAPHNKGWHDMLLRVVGSTDPVQIAIDGHGPAQWYSQAGQDPKRLAWMREQFQAGKPVTLHMDLVTVNGVEVGQADSTPDAPTPAGGDAIDRAVKNLVSGGSTLAASDIRKRAGIATDYAKTPEPPAPPVKTPPHALFRTAIPIAGHGAFLGHRFRYEDLKLGHVGNDPDPSVPDLYEVHLSLRRGKRTEDFLDAMREMRPGTVAELYLPVRFKGNPFPLVVSATHWEWEESKSSYLVVFTEALPDMTQAYLASGGAVPREMPTPTPEPAPVIKAIPIALPRPYITADDIEARLSKSLPLWGSKAAEQNAALFLDASAEFDALAAPRRARDIDPALVKRVTVDLAIGILARREPNAGLKPRPLDDLRTLLHGGDPGSSRSQAHVVYPTPEVKVYHDPVLDELRSLQRPGEALTDTFHRLLDEARTSAAKRVAERLETGLSGLLHSAATDPTT